MILVSLFLTGCAAFQAPADLSRTDNMHATLVLDIVDYDTMRERCAPLVKALACTVDGRVVMHGWEAGHLNREDILGHEFHAHILGQGH